MPSRRRRYRRRPKPQVKKPPANEEINTPQVRVITEDGSQLGVMDTKDAIQKAQEAESDLVMVAGKADPPVARIMNLGKHMYEKRKKDAKQKAKSKGKDVKGVRIGFKTDEHDWNFRLKQTENFLESGHKVKLEVRLRGREKQRFDMAEEKLHQFTSELSIPARQEGSTSRSHNSLSLILTKAN